MKLPEFRRVKTVHVIDLRSGEMPGQGEVNVPAGVDIALLVSDVDEETCRLAIERACEDGAVTSATLYVFPSERNVVRPVTPRNMLQLARQLSKKDEPTSAERVLAGMLARMPEGDPLTWELQTGKGDDGQTDPLTGKLRTDDTPEA